MIRPAAAADLPEIAALYETLLDREAASGTIYTNWKKGSYPTVETARISLEAGTLYVGRTESGVLWGVTTLNGIQLPEYGEIPWSIPAEEEQVGVIHTLCIHPEHTRQGRARQLVEFCEAESRRQGRSVMRLDTWEGNLPANRLYPSLGYRYAGAAEFFFQGYIRENLNCYEKLL